MRVAVLAAVGAALAGGYLPAAAAVGPPLGAARSFAVLGGSTVSNTGATTIVTGDVGVSPGSSIVGFGPGQVTGGIYVGGSTEADQAHNDAEIAYFFLKGMSSIPANNLTSLDLGGMTLAPAVYKFDTSAQLTGALVLDAGGDPNAVFVFQIGSTLTTASGAAVTVINTGGGYDESNVFWQIGTAATLGSGTAFIGNILADDAITIVAGSSMTGNALAINGAVTLDSNVVTSPPLPPPVTAAPINLTAVLTGLPASPGADLGWNDASDNETEFRVFRRDGAGPAFVLIATILSPDEPGTGGVLTYQDPVLVPSLTYTYRVTAFGATDGESAPSNEALVETGVLPPALWLDVQLGRRRSVIRDRNRPQKDRIRVRGSYTLIDVDTSVPTVMDDVDPRADGVTFQVTAPGELVLASIPANDPRWKVSKKGVYRWKSDDGGDAPAWSVRMDTRKSEFTFKSRRNEFSAVPVNSITVSLTSQSTTGSDTRNWDQPQHIPDGNRALFTLPR